MNHISTKKTIAGLLALGMLVSAASCGSNGGKNSKADQTAEKTITNAYSAVDLGTGTEYNDIQSLYRLNDNDDMLFVAYGEHGPELNIANKDFSDVHKIDDDLGMGKDYGGNVSVAVLPNGNIAAAVTAVDYGDYKVPDFESPDFDYENFDYEEMEKAANYSYWVYTIGTDGKVITKNAIEGLDKYMESDDEDMQSGLYFSNVYACGSDDKVILGVSGMEESYAVLGLDGKLQSEIELDENTWFYNACTDSNGDLAFSSWEDGSLKIKYIDCSSFKLSDKVIDLKDTDINSTNAMLTGDGDYELYVSASSGLYGIKSDGSADEIINWVDSDLSGDYVRSVIKLSSGDFVIYYYDWSSDEKGFYTLTRRDASELASAKVITIATMGGDPSISSMITKYNKGNKDYRLKIKDYSQYDEWDEESDKRINSGENQLKLDIVSGNAPDMIISYTNSLSHTLGSKGTFVDLNEYLGKDGAVSKEDIVPTVLNMCEENGKLYSICSGFGIQTFAAKKKYVDKENWSLDDFIEAYDKLPKDMKLFSEGNGRDQVFSYLILGLDIYDPATNKINVDTPEFVKLLEFCNQFSEEEGFDWEHASQSEMENYWNETEAAVRNDKALLYDLYLSDPRSFAAAKQGYIGEDMTLVGIPSVNGGGAQLMSNAYMFILSSSEYKDTCWDFIKGFFDEEYQTSDNMYYLPALKSAFETKLDESMKKPHYTDDSGKEIEYDDMVYIGGKEIKIDPLTKEERDFVADYIANAKNPSIGSLSDDVLALAAEEVQAYFKGERSAEETAKLIQSRAEIMLSEQS